MWSKCTVLRASSSTVQIKIHLWMNMIQVSRSSQSLKRSTRLSQKHLSRKLRTIPPAHFSKSLLRNSRIHLRKMTILTNPLFATTKYHQMRRFQKRAIAPSKKKNKDLWLNLMPSQLAKAKEDNALILQPKWKASFIQTTVRSTRHNFASMKEKPCENHADDYNSDIRQITNIRLDL